MSCSCVANVMHLAIDARVTSSYPSHFDLAYFVKVCG